MIKTITTDQTGISKNYISEKKIDYRSYPSRKNITKYGMLALAYQVMDYLKQNGCKEKLEWDEYHEFPIAEIPYECYKKTMKAIGAKKKDFTLQIGKCLSTYEAVDHYHKMGHQLVVVMGPDCGFSEVTAGSTIKIGSKIYEAIAGEAYYFPTNVPHNFRGEFYFINLQNPPLIDEDGHDDYYS